jgi:IMP dehydrogenase
VKVCKENGVPLISDGGNRYSGNMCKAIAAGADCVMLGRLVGGCEESPGKVMYKEGKLVKIFRGMAGLGANISKN